MDTWNKVKAWIGAHDWILWIGGIALLIWVVRKWDTLKNFARDVTSLQSESIPGWLYGLGIAAILASLLVLCAEAYYKLKLLKNPPGPAPEGFTGIDWPEFMKALGDAPKWIGLIVAGGALIVLGLMADGYKWQSGGFTGPGTPVAETLVPDPATDSSDEPAEDTAPTSDAPSDEETGNADFPQEETPTTTTIP